MNSWETKEYWQLKDRIVELKDEVKRHCHNGKEVQKALHTACEERDTLKAEVERLKELCKALVGEEELHQEGKYETEMEKLRDINIVRYTKILHLEELLREVLASGVSYQAPGYCEVQLSHILRDEIKQALPKTGEESG